MGEIIKASSNAVKFLRENNLGTLIDFTRFCAPILALSFEWRVKDTHMEATLLQNLTFIISLLLHSTHSSKDPLFSNSFSFVPLIICKDDNQYIYAPIPEWGDRIILKTPLLPVMAETFRASLFSFVYVLLRCLEGFDGALTIPDDFISNLTKNLIGFPFKNEITQGHVFKAVFPVAFYGCKLLSVRSFGEWDRISLGDIFMENQILKKELHNNTKLFQSMRDLTWGGNLAPQIRIESAVQKLLNNWDLKVINEYRLLSKVIAPHHIDFLHESWQKHCNSGISFEENDGGACVYFSVRLGARPKPEESFLYQSITPIRVGAIANVKVLMENDLGIDMNETDPILDTLMTLDLENNKNVEFSQNKEKIEATHKILWAVWCELVRQGAGRISSLELMKEYHQMITHQYNETESFRILAHNNHGFWAYLNRPLLFNSKGKLEADTISGNEKIYDPHNALFTKSGVFDPAKGNRKMKDTCVEEGRRLVGYHTVGNGVEYCFKRSPELPGIELAVQRFMFLLFGSGTPYSEVIKMEETGDVFLVSQRILGERLDKAISNPNIVENLHPQRTSELIISSMLTNPEDGRLQNYVATYDKIANLWYLVSVDNDHSLGSALTQKVPVNLLRNEKIKPRSVIFCLKEMDDPIHPAVRNRLANLDVYNFLKAWLQSLMEGDNLQHKWLKGLKERNFLFKSGTRLQVPLTHEVLEREYSKFMTIKREIRKNPSVTHRELLRSVEPSWEAYYRKCSGTLVERFEMTDGRPASTMSALGYLHAVTGSSRLFGSIEQAIKELKAIKDEYGKQIFVKDFNEFTQIKNVVAQQEFLATIRFSDLPSKQREFWIKSLGKYPGLKEWKVLKLHLYKEEFTFGARIQYNRKIMRYRLKFLFKPKPDLDLTFGYRFAGFIPRKTFVLDVLSWPLHNLMYLDLSQSGVNDNLVKFSQVCPSLRVLKAVNCDIKSLQSDKIEHATFLTLRKLDLSWSRSLEIIKIFTPSIEKLYVNECKNLHSINVGIPYIKNVRAGGSDIMYIFARNHLPTWFTAASFLKKKYDGYKSWVLELGNGVSEIRINLRHVPDSKTLNAMAQLFQHSSSLKSLQLEIIEITKSAPIFTVLSHIPLLSLKCIISGDSAPVNSTAAFASLQKALATCNTLTELDLTNCPLGDEGTGEVAKILQNSPVKYAGLSGCSIGDSGLTHIRDVLQNNKTLTVLDLDNNLFQPSSLSNLVEVLQNNTTLTELNTLFPNEEIQSILARNRNLNHPKPSVHIQAELQPPSNRFADISYQLFSTSSLETELGLWQNLKNYSFPKQHFYHPFHIILNLQGDNIRALSFLSQISARISRFHDQSLSLFHQLGGSSSGGVCILALTVPHTYYSSKPLHPHQLADLIQSGTPLAALSSIFTHNSTRPYMSDLENWVTVSDKNTVYNQMDALKSKSRDLLVQQISENLLSNPGSDISLDLVGQAPRDTPICLISLGVTNGSIEAHEALMARQSDRFVYVHPVLEGEGVNQDALWQQAREIADFLIENQKHVELQRKKISKKRGKYF